MKNYLSKGALLKVETEHMPPIVLGVYFVSTFNIATNENFALALVMAKTEYMPSNVAGISLVSAIRITVNCISNSPHRHTHDMIDM